MKRRQSMSGVLDWFRKKPESKGIIYLGPSGGARLPAQVPPTPAVPRPTLKERLLSLIPSFEASPEKKEKLLSVIQGIEEGKEKQLPALLKAIDILPPSIKASPPMEMTVSEAVLRQEVWKQLFEEAAEESPEEVSSQEPVQASIFDVAMEPQEEEIRVPRVEETWLRPPSPRAPHEEWPGNEPPLYWHTAWKVPSPYEVAYWITTSEGKWDLIGLFEDTLKNTDYPDWKRRVQESAHTGEPAEHEFAMVAHWNSAFEDLGHFLAIPDYIMDIYFGEITSEEDAMERTRLFHTEVLDPYLKNLSVALDALKPRGLKGWYEISPTDDYSWWLKYVEAKYPG